jgi:hypothetical protein
MAPGFDVTEAHPFAGVGNCDDCFAFMHFIADILRTSFCNACTSCFRTFLHTCGDGFCVNGVAAVGYSYDNIMVGHIQLQIQTLPDSLKYNDKIVSALTADLVRVITI